VNKMATIIRWKRERLGLEGQELARMICVGKSCVSRWENGHRDVPCEMVPALARILGPEILNQRMAECPVLRAAQGQKKKAA